MDTPLWLGPLAMAELAGHGASAGEGGKEAAWCGSGLCLGWARRLFVCLTMLDDEGGLLGVHDEPGGAQHTRGD